MWVNCLCSHSVSKTSRNAVETTPSSITIHIDNKILGQLLSVGTSVQTKCWGSFVRQKQTSENTEVISLTSCKLHTDWLSYNTNFIQHRPSTEPHSPQKNKKCSTLDIILCSFPCSHNIHIGLYRRIFRQINPVHGLTSHFLRINFNIILTPVT